MYDKGDGEDRCECVLPVVVGTQVVKPCPFLVCCVRTLDGSYFHWSCLNLGAVCSDLDKRFVESHEESNCLLSRLKPPVN
jgi:hypothetical protein